MGGHALRGAFVAWMGLIVLETLGSADNTGKLGSLLTDINDLISHAIRQDVPLIPDRSKGFTDSDGNYHPNVPSYLGGGTTTAPGAGDRANPNIVPYDGADPNHPNSQYDNPNPNKPGGIQE